MLTASSTQASRHGDPHKILRFRKSERLVHWAFAVPFLICYATAIILIVAFYDRPHDPQREIVSWIHRLCGLVFFGLPPAIVLLKRGDIRFHLNNVRQAWLWTFADLKWLAFMGAAAVNPRVKLPDQGKFNAAEKLNFMLLMTTHPFYLLTGALIWFTHGAFLAWMAHIFMVALATPLIFGHMYMAILNPGTRVGLPGMITGYVDRSWAKHHYRKWYDEKHPEVSVVDGAISAAAAVDGGGISDISYSGEPHADIATPEPTPGECVDAMLAAMNEPLLTAGGTGLGAEPVEEEGGLNG